MKDEYTRALEDAGSLLEIQAVGKRIKEDKQLEVGDVLELHQIYTRKKKQYV